MEIQDVIDYLLQHDLDYPGPHQYQQKTKTFSPKKQLLIIWKFFCNQIKEHMQSNDYLTVIDVPSFGSFSFMPYNDISIKNNNTFMSTITNINNINKQKPIFQLDKIYEKIIKNYLNEKSKNISTLYPGYIPKKQTYIKWNPYPIAKICKVKPNFVSDAIKAITKAIYDLVVEGFSLIIDMNFVLISFQNGPVNYLYDTDLLFNERKNDN